MERKKKFTVLAFLLVWLTAVASLISFAATSSPVAKANCLATFLACFALFALAGAAKWLRNGRIGVGGRGGSATHYIYRENEPGKFWKYWVLVFALGLVLLVLVVLIFARVLPVKTLF